MALPLSNEPPHVKLTLQEKLGNLLDTTSFSHAIKKATNAAVLAREDVLPVPQIFYPAHLEI